METCLGLCRSLACAVLVFGACGCLSPEDRFLQTGAQAYDGSEGLAGVAFGALIDTKFLSGQQFMFKVRLMDEQARPIKSRNGAYQDEHGNVAAQKTVMILSGGAGTQPAEVRIPAHELELRSGDFPVWISYGLNYPDGSTYAEVFRPLPYNTQSVVQRFVEATYGHEPREPAPPRSVRSRTVRRPTIGRSTRWQPNTQNRGPGFCPQHGVACDCPLRQDVPDEYVQSRPRSTPPRSRQTTEPTRPRREPRSAPDRRDNDDPR